MNVRLTRHAGKRMKERLGIKSEKERIKMAERALAKGKPIDVEEAEYHGETAAKLLIQYQDGIYVFGANLSLITVIPVKKRHRLSRAEAREAIALRESKAAMAYA